MTFSTLILKYNSCRRGLNRFMNDKNPITHSMIGFLLAPYRLSPIGHFLSLWAKNLVVTGFLAPISKSVRIVGCGGRTWTNDLRVMSPTSYQLLHPASNIKFATSVSQMSFYIIPPCFSLSTQNYTFYIFFQNFFYGKFVANSTSIHSNQPPHTKSC